MSFLVVEGTDGSGKTTVVEWLHQHHGYVTRHVGPPGQGGSFEELLSSWWHDRQVGLERVAYDRGHLGQEVYGLARGRTLARGEWGALSALLASVNGETIFLDVSALVCWDRVVARGGHDVSLLKTQDRLARDRQLFREAFAKEPTRKRKFDSGADFLRSWTPDTHWRPDPLVDPRGMGAAVPLWWVVGEQLSRASFCDAPFVTATGLDMVWSAVDVTRVRCTNALAPDSDLEAARRGKFDPGDLAYLAQTYEQLRSVRVPQAVGAHRVSEHAAGRRALRTLALGRTAAHALRAAGLTVDVEMEHPSYARRFTYGTRDGWRERLRAVTAEGGRT